LQGEIPTVTSLGLPAIFEEIAKEKNRPRSGHRPTGSGKTTTLAAILNEINTKQPVHIVTLEDPIEFVHPTLRATFNQRELGHDFNNYPNGLRAALRQAPKVIWSAKMRDRATVEVALMAAENGHLVLSTLHTVDAGQAIIVSSAFFPWEKNNNCASAWPIRCVHRQPKTAPKIGGGRQLLTEILGHNLRTRETIAIGEGEHRSFYEIIEASSPFGWMTFDQSILQAYEKRLRYRRNSEVIFDPQGKSDRGIDIIQKTRGVDGDLDSVCVSTCL